MRTAFSQVLLANLSALAVASCGGGAPGDQMAAIPRDSAGYYRTRLSEMETAAAEKDSLVRDLAEATQLIVSVSEEIATVQRPGQVVGPRLEGESRAADERTQLLERVRDLTTRVRRSEARLSTTRRRLDAMTARSDSLSTTLSAYEQSLNDLGAIVANQKNSIAALEARIDTLALENARLGRSNEELTDTVGALTVRENTVYVVAGTKKELLARGLIVAEGGTRFLLFTRTGETLRPAEQLDTLAFTVYDRRVAMEIPLPKANKNYRIVSRHNLLYLDPTTVTKGKIRGSIKILSPLEFWAPSRFLILVED